MSDADDWAKEDCACGHARFQHERGTGACLKKRMRRARPEGLPVAVYLPGQEDDWSAWPINWPPTSEWPEVEQPCCSGFYDAGLAAAEAGP